MVVDANEKLIKLTKLTPKQTKCWNDLVKALQEYKKSGGRLYSCLDTIRAFNGNNYSNSIDYDEGLEYVDMRIDNEIYVKMDEVVQLLPDYTWVDLSSFADDGISFQLKEKHYNKITVDNNESEYIR